MPYRTISRFFGALSYLFLVLFLPHFVLFSTASVQGQLLAKGLNIGKYDGVITFLFVLCAAMSYSLSRLFAVPYSAIASSRGLKPTTSRRMDYLFFFLSLIVLGVSISGLRGPLTYDENNIGSFLSWATFSNTLDLIATTSYHLSSTLHVISILSSFISIKIFGISPFALRLPSVLFCLLFLGLLFYYGRRTVAAPILILIYLGIVMNGQMAFHLQSSRGYVSAIAFATLPFFVVFQTISYGAIGGRREWILFTLFSVLTIVSHTNGANFIALMLCSLVIWLTLNARRVDHMRWEYLRRLTVILLLLMPLVLVMNFCELIATQGWILNGHPPSNSVLPMMGYSLGLNRLYWVKILAILCVGLVFLKFRNGSKIQHDFLTVFLGFSLFFFTVLISLLDSHYLAPRFFLFFLIPFSLWCGSALSEFSGPSGRILYLSTMLFLCFLPAVYRKEVMVSEISIANPFYRFIERMEPLFSEKSHCLEGWPKGFLETIWLEQLYFSKNKVSSDCKERYHFLFGKGPLPPGKFSLVFDDSFGGRRLFIQNRKPSDIH